MQSRAEGTGGMSEMQSRLTETSGLVADQAADAPLALFNCSDTVRRTGRMLTG